MYQLLQIAWVFIKRSAEWKPLQFLAFVFVYRIFEKLKAFEPPTSTFTVSIHKITFAVFCFSSATECNCISQLVHHYCEIYMNFYVSFSYFAMDNRNFLVFYVIVHTAFKVHSSFFWASSGGRWRWRTDDEDGEKTASFSGIGFWLYSYCILGMFSVRVI